MSPLSGSNSPENRAITPSNVITLVRICLVPVFVVAFLAPWPEWFGISEDFYNVKAIIATVIFVLISCTDWIDGYLARRRNEITVFGQFIDPLADKILVAAALLALIELDVLPSWPVLIILTREFIVAGIRMIAASQGKVIPASWIGKAKTVMQIIAIVLFLIKESLYLPDFNSVLNSPLYILSWIVMLIAVILTVVSLFDYINKARHLLVFTPSRSNSERDNGLSKNDSASYDDLSSIALQVIDRAKAQNITLGTAESLTGGMIATVLTSVPGSSAVLRGSVVSYSCDVKHDVLRVDGDLLDAQGAVDKNVALEMAEGAHKLLNCDICVAVTGIAGPGGAEPNKPVGTVWIALKGLEDSQAQEYHFSGDREEVRLQTTFHALNMILSQL